MAKRPQGLDVSVVLTHLNDSRGVRTLASLARGTHVPAEVVLADGGSRPDVLARFRDAAADWPFRFRVEDVLGTAAESRELAWPRTEGEIIAFIDADEVAPPEWLDRITQPLRAKEADFAAGPTKPWELARRWDHYHARLDAWFYRTYVAHDVVYAPMGNTAWGRKVFTTLRKNDDHVFDRTLSRGGEDFDVNLRAVLAGFRGAYVPQALLFHDYAGLRGYRQTLRKKYAYALAEFRLKRRHAAYFQAQKPPVIRERKPWHTVELLEPFVRRWARFKSRRTEPGGTP